MAFHVEAHGNVCTGHALSACFWMAHRAECVGWVGIDATVFSAAQSGHSSPRLQGVCLQLAALALAGDRLILSSSTATSQQNWAEAASLMELLVHLIF